MMRRYGHTWDYWENNLTFPMYLALLDDMARHPAADDLWAARFKYRPPDRLVPKSKPPPKLMGEPEFEP